MIAANVQWAIELLSYRCSACKGCEKTCSTFVILRVLRGEPATLCPMCDEWWEGPVEFADDDMTMKQVECPFCARLSQSATQIVQRLTDKLIGHDNNRRGCL